MFFQYRVVLCSDYRGDGVVADSCYVMIFVLCVCISVLQRLAGLFV